MLEILFPTHKWRVINYLWTNQGCNWNNLAGCHSTNASKVCFFQLNFLTVFCYNSYYPNLLSRSLWNMFMILSKMCIKFSFSKESLTMNNLFLLHYLLTNIMKNQWAQITYEEMALVCLWSLLPPPMSGISYPFYLSSWTLFLLWTLWDAPAPCSDIPWLKLAWVWVFLHQTLPMTEWVKK